MAIDCQDMASLTRHYRMKTLDNLELLHTQHLRDGYTNHMHEEYSLCWMESGLVTTYYRGTTHLSPIHSFTVMNPAEPHHGEVISEENVSYYSLYPSETAMRQLCEECFGTPTLPSFKKPIILDKVLTEKLQRFVTVLEIPTSSLELSTHYLSFLGYLIKHYADKTCTAPKTQRELSAVEKAKAYLHDNFQNDITLEELASSVGLNRAYLIRAFKKTTGLPPHAYLTQLRLSEAKRQLIKGVALSQVALNTGFADQSHFSRTFKHTYGITPAVYAKATFIRES